LLDAAIAGFADIGKPKSHHGDTEKGQGIAKSTMGEEESPGSPTLPSWEERRFLKGLPYRQIVASAAGTRSPFFLDKIANKW
jgi:hypothetical protein